MYPQKTWETTGEKEVGGVLKFWGGGRRYKKGQWRRRWGCESGGVVARGVRIRKKGYVMKLKEGSTKKGVLVELTVQGFQGGRDDRYNQ